MDSKKIFKQYIGSIEDFKLWLPDHETELEGCIVFIHEQPQLNIGLTDIAADTTNKYDGYIYANGYYYTAKDIKGLDVATLQGVLSGGNGITAKVCNYKLKNSETPAWNLQEYVTTTEYNNLSADLQAKYDALSEQGKLIFSAVLTENIVSNSESSVGYAAKGFEFKAGMTLDEVLKAIFVKEIWPVANIITTVTIDGGSITSPTVTVEVTNGKYDDNNVEVGATLNLLSIPAPVVTPANGASSSTQTTTLKYGYKVNNEGAVLRNNPYLSSAAITQNCTAGTLTITDQDHAFRDIEVVNNSIVGGTYIAEEGDNKLYTKNSGNNSITATANTVELCYCSNTDNHTDLNHMVTIQGSAQPKYLNKTSSWLRKGQYVNYFNYACAAKTFNSLAEFKALDATHENWGDNDIDNRAKADCADNTYFVVVSRTKPTKVPHDSMENPGDWFQGGTLTSDTGYLLNIYYFPSEPFLNGKYSIKNKQ